MDEEFYLPEMRVTFTPNIPLHDLRNAEHPNASHYALVREFLRKEQSLGGVFEDGETGDMMMLVHAIGILPPVGAILVKFTYPD